MKVEVRLASAREVARCLEIALDLPEWFNPRGIENMERDLARDRLTIAVQGNRVVGFFATRDGGQLTELTWMAVRRNAQRKGVGTALLQRVEREARLRGRRALLVRTLAATVESGPYEATRAFYTGQGFRLARVIDPYPGWDPGNPCAEYEKLLG